jgi:ABC-type thiamine transport system ATPase subunit
MLKVQKLCDTILGNTCYVLTVTENVNDVQANAQKQVIMMTGRVHPGEANSSFMV